MVEDEEDPYYGCWAHYSESYHPPEEHGNDDHHGTTLDPHTLDPFHTSQLATARAGGKAKVGGGGGGDDDDEPEHPGAFMPCNYRQWEELLLVWAIPMTWFYLIFFAG